MKTLALVAVVFSLLLVEFPTRGWPLLRGALAAPVVDVAQRKAALSRISEEEVSWCQVSFGDPEFSRHATITGPIQRQISNAQAAGNALFGAVEGYYRGWKGSAERLRDLVAEGARIGAFTDMAPYSPPEFQGYNPMNEPIFQVANFMVPLAHAYLIVAAEYPDDAELLSSVRAWGDRLFEVTWKSRDDFKGRARGIDRRALIAAGWAHWRGAVGNPDAIAQAHRYYKRALSSFGRGGKDRIWRYKGKHRINYVNMTVAAALAAAYALHRAGVEDVYTLAPKRGSVVDGAAWVWDRLLEDERRHSDLLRLRHGGGRSVAWIELFIREFPDHPSSASMREWRSRSEVPLSGNMAGGPTTCLYRPVPGAS